MVNVGVEERMTEMAKKGNRTAVCIKRKELRIFMLMLPFCEPYCISVLFFFLHRLFMAAKILAAAIIILDYIYGRKNGKPRANKLFLWTLVFWIYLVSNTLFQVGNNSRLLVGTLTVVGVMLLIENNSDDISSILDVFFQLLEILIYFNLFLMLLFPNGLYVTSAGNTNNWLLGYDNFFAQTFIPAMTLSFINIGYKQKKLRSLCLILAINFSTLLTLPATLLVTIIFMDLVFFLGINRFKKVFNVTTMLVITLIFTIGFIFFDMASSFSFFIVGILGRDLSFTGRTTIWTSTIEMFLKKPIFGYGFVDGTQRVSMMGTRLLGAYNSHNQILELLWEGGIVLLFLFSVVMFITMKNTRHFTSRKATQFIGVGIIAFLIIFIDQAITQMYPIWFFALLSLTDHLEAIDEDMNRGNIV